MLSENLITLSFCNKTSWSIVSYAFCTTSINIIPINKPSSKPFKLYLLKKTNIYLFNDYLKNLIDSCIIYLHLIERHLFGHELPFQWSLKLMEAMRLACIWKDQFFTPFKKEASVLQLCKHLGRIPVRLRDCKV